MTDFVEGYEKGANDVLLALYEELVPAVGEMAARLLTDRVGTKAGMRSDVEEERQGLDITPRGLEFATILRSEAVMAGIDLDDKLAFGTWLMDEAPKLHSMQTEFADVLPGLYVPMMIAFEASLLRADS